MSLNALKNEYHRQSCAAMSVIFGYYGNENDGIIVRGASTMNFYGAYLSISSSEIIWIKESTSLKSLYTEANLT